MLKTDLFIAFIEKIDLNLPWLMPLLEGVERVFPVNQRIVACALLTSFYLFSKLSKRLPFAFQPRR